MERPRSLPRRRSCRLVGLAGGLAIRVIEPSIVGVPTIVEAHTRPPTTTPRPERGWQRLVGRLVDEDGNIMLTHPHHPRPRPAPAGRRPAGVFGSTDGA